MDNNGRHASADGDPITNGLPRDPRGAAAYYLGLGIAPLPLPFRSKEPGFAGWQSFRLTSEALDRHFPADQPRGVGVLNGAPSGNLADVDLDTAEARRAALMLLPPTGWRFGRPSAPGSHWIYRTDVPFDKEKQQYLDPTDQKCLLELRGTGGHTVFPPTRHETADEDVAWESFTTPASGTLAGLQQAVQNVAVVALLARHWPDHGWHHMTLALAGGLLRGGLPLQRVEKIVQALWKTAGTHDDPSDREGAVRTTAEKLKAGENVVGWPKLAEYLGRDGDRIVSALRAWLGLTATVKIGKGPKPIRTLPPYRPFPCQFLPEPLRAMVVQGAESLGCDTAYLALPALSVVAGLIGNNRVVMLKRDWKEPCVLWTAVVGDSGTLKSPAQKLFLDPLRQIQGKRIKEHEAALAQYDIDLAEWEKARKKDPSAAGNKPAKPTCVRTVCDDVTVERLAVLLAENPRGLLVARDELAGWLLSFNQYKARGGSDLAAWLAMHRAESITVDRKTGDRPLVYVPRAAVSISGGIQPETVARVLTPEYIHSGLAARIVFAMPPKTRKDWREVEIHPEVVDAYERMLHRLIQLASDVEDDGDPLPFRVRLNPDAKVAWVAFYRWWARRQEAVEGPLASCFSKLEGLAARFALIHHTLTNLADGTDCDSIEPVSIEAGVALTRWFADEAQRIYGLLVESEDDRDVRRLIEFIRAREGKVTVKQLQNSNSRKYPDRDSAHAALAELVDGGLARWEEEAKVRKGGHTVCWCVLLPTTDASDSCSDDGEDEGEGPSDACSDGPSGGSLTPAPASGLNGDHKTSCDAARPSPLERESEASVVGKEIGGAACRDGGVAPSDRESEQESEGTAAFVVVSDPCELVTVRQAVGESDRVGLDVETTGLNPRTDRVRLLSLACDTIDGGTFTYVIDCFAVDPSPLWEVLRDRPIIAHHASFDLSFLRRLGFEPGPVHDTMILSQLLTAGTRPDNGLAPVVERELGRTLNKAEQASDWSRPTLSDDQVRYAALDAAVLRPLYETLSAKIEAAGLTRVAEAEQRCLPALVWLATSGVGFDVENWKRLTAEAGEESDRLGRELDVVVPPEQTDLLGGGWNWDSPAQVTKAFASLGITLASTADDALAAVTHPAAALLRQYRAVRKRCSTYGTDWLKHLAADGRVYAGWRQIGADSGRMACRAPNLQNLPRDVRYRQCFRPGEGRVLVKADYSQIELRIAAKVANEAAMIDAYNRGLDLHTLTAQRLLGKAEVSKADRQLAKAVNFGLLYGMGWKGFRAYAQSNYGVELTDSQARQYRDAFFEAYPGLRKWHLSVQARNPRETRTLAGRRRLFPQPRFTEQVNTPVQGSGADGLKLALALLWERRSQVPGAFPVLVVHDEIVVECDADQAEAAAAWVKQAMLDGMAPLVDPVPVEVEVTVARTWGGD